MLDYDGTLAPFRVDRLRARPSARTQQALRASARDERTTLAIISGRPIAELDIVLEPLSAILIGEHGWESRRPGEPLVQHPTDEEADVILDRAAAWLEVEGGAGLLERKRTAVMLHTRGLAGMEVRRWIQRARTAWGAEAAAAGGRLRLMPVNGGIELRATGRDKGKSVRELTAGAPAGTFAVYLGDDATDEDAFRAISPVGVGIRVGSNHARTAARHRLASRLEVERFLRRWLSAAAEAPALVARP